jgi:hypothetical protein
MAQFQKFQKPIDLDLNAGQQSQPHRFETFVQRTTLHAAPLELSHHVIV